jgi:hypothetical protein
VSEEVIDKQCKVLVAIAQRRQVQLEHAKPIIQVLAELLLADEDLQILIGGGDDADVDGYFLRGADGQERVPLQDA